MKFHLDHTPLNPGFGISHHDQVLLIGSCFAENIGQYFNDHRFRTLVNPGGILFNPFSIANSLQASLEGTDPEPYLLHRDTLYLSYLHHSSVQAADKASLLKTIGELRARTAEFLQRADLLILTFGSAFVYKHLALDTVVANCHKQPASTFGKFLLSPGDIVSRYNSLLALLRQINPKLKFMFTVSPVKYLKDGLVENNLSKSILSFSVHEIIRQNRDCFYFPAYELVTDDLRDYRFYKKDLAHPNEQAVEYIWQKFSDTFFCEHTRSLNEKIHRLNLALGHNVMSSGSQESRQLESFIARQREEIEKLLAEE